MSRLASCSLLILNSKLNTEIRKGKRHFYSLHDTPAPGAGEGTRLGSGTAVSGRRGHGERHAMGHRRCRPPRASRARSLRALWGPSAGQSGAKRKRSPAPSPQLWHCFCSTSDESRGSDLPLRTQVRSKNNEIHSQSIILSQLLSLSLK